MDIKKLLKENKLVENSRKANEMTAWKDQFYKAYNEKNFDLAQQLYVDKFNSFSPKVPDVHAGYKLQKQKEKQVTLYIAVFFAVFIIVVYLIAK